MIVFLSPKLISFSILKNRWGQSVFTVSVERMAYVYNHLMSRKITATSTRKAIRFLPWRSTQVMGDLRALWFRACCRKNWQWGHTRWSGFRCLCASTMPSNVRRRTTYRLTTFSNYSRPSPPRASTQTWRLSLPHITSTLTSTLTQ